MPKKIVYLLFSSLLFYPSSVFYLKGEKGIRVKITNLRNNKGHVLISLFKEGVGYPGEPGKAYKVAKLSIVDKSATVLFSQLPTAHYAIAILHDENDDAKMNKNFFGLPEEGYGFSNNAMGMFGPPSFNKASFSHLANSETILNIKTRY